MKINWTKLIVAILICQMAGVIGSVFTNMSVNDWFKTLQKPSFAPAGGVIGSVWVVLFLLMGISLYDVWVSKKRKDNCPFVVFGIQLFLNIFWSVCFFGLRNPFLAFVEIIFLWFSILLNILTFYRVSKTASYLLIPYILWVSFASFLNFYLWKLNV